MQRGFPAVVITCLTFLSACYPGNPKGLSMAYSTYAQSPVLLTVFQINGLPVLPGETGVQGLSDLNRPYDRYGSYNVLMDLDANEALHIEAVWVELLTQRAYRAELTVPVQGLQRDPANYAEMMPVFGPGGLLLITSDPIPETVEATETHNAGQVCGTRVPALDRDYSDRTIVKHIFEYERPDGVGKGCE